MRPAARRPLAAVFLAAALALPGTGAAQDTPSPSSSLTVAGRKLEPAGRLTPVGSFPTGGALTVNGGSAYLTSGTTLTIDSRTDYTEAQTATQSGLASSTLAIRSATLTGNSEKATAAERRPEPRAAVIEEAIAEEVEATP